MVGRESRSQDISRRFLSYFEALAIEIHSCTGSPDVGGKHLQILDIPRRSLHIPLQEHSSFRGDLSLWFANFISNQGTTTSNETCFRTAEGKAVCSGNRTTTQGLVLSIPIMLALHLPDSTDPPIWNYPETLTPLTKKLAKTEGVIYDLVGFGLHSQSACHFTARYTRCEGPEVYFYDGMKNGGYTVVEEGATLASDVANTSRFPKGFAVTTAIYHLRGGSKAQEIFYNTRCDFYRKKFKIDISGECFTLPKCSYLGNLIQLPVEARTWIKNAKLRKVTVEYVSALPKPKTDELANSDSEDAVEATKRLPVRKSLVKLSASELELLASTSDSPESEDENTQARPLSANPSLPDSEWSLNCRCGLKGDGNILYREDEGSTIQCNDCLDWSHVACQKDGRASQLAEGKKFICDICEGQAVLLPRNQRKQRESTRKYVLCLPGSTCRTRPLIFNRKLESRMQYKKPLKERLL
jgi:hypothetical protein